MAETFMLIQGWDRNPEGLRNGELKQYKYFSYKDQEFILLYFLYLLKYNISITFDIYYPDSIAATGI